MKNPYQTLGVEPTATPAEIKAAWRKLCAQHHPDKHQGAEAVEHAAAMAEINAAYEVLSNPQNRLQYDQTGNADSLDNLAVSVLREMFDAVLEQERCRNPVKDVERMLAEVKSQMTDRIKLASKRAKALERRLARFQKDPGLIKAMVEAKLRDIEHTITTSERALEINTHAQGMLEAFSYETDPDPMDAETRRMAEHQRKAAELYHRFGGGFGGGSGQVWP
ncbi:MAG: DnaJ domain-containing protein [Aquabacterium sp.]|uniref:DnaJ domain-containing protein n=1 Tax=Aquabacterium sp. TaxID=1872578 RepID=UPI003BB169B6